MKGLAYVLSVGAVVALISCVEEPKPGTVEEETAPLPYDGETSGSGGGIPVFEPGVMDAGSEIIDAGNVTVDTRCCQTAFSISDGEPADAVGKLQGEHGKLAGGISLSRTDAGWSASTCFPVNSSSRYWYAFSWDAGFVDGGIDLLPDGGEEAVLIYKEGRSLRASDREPSFVDSEGTRRNYYREVSSCDGLDGGVPP